MNVATVVFFFPDGTPVVGVPRYCLSLFTVGQRLRQLFHIEYNSPSGDNSDNNNNVVAADVMRAIGAGGGRGQLHGENFYLPMPRACRPSPGGRPPRPRHVHPVRSTPAVSGVVTGLRAAFTPVCRPRRFGISGLAPCRTLGSEKNTRERRSGYG